MILIGLVSLVSEREGNFFWRLIELLVVFCWLLLIQLLFLGYFEAWWRLQDITKYSTVNTVLD